MSIDRRASNLTTIGALSVALLVLLPLNPAEAQNVSVSKYQLDRATWSSNAVYHSYRSNSASDTLLLVYSYHLFRENPGLPANLALKDLNSYRENLHSLETHVVEGYKVSPKFKNTAGALLDLASISKSPNIKAGVATTQALLTLGYEGIESFWHAGTQISAQRSLLELENRAGSYVDKTASDLWDLAQRDPEVATTLDAFFGSKFKSSVHDGAKEIISRNPEFAEHAAIVDMDNAIRPDGSLTRNINDLKKDVRTTTKETNKTIEADTAELKKLNKKLADVWQQQTAAAEAQRQFEASRIAICSGAATVELFSKIIALQDKELAGRLAQFGNGVAQAASAINEYGHDVALLEEQYGDFGNVLGTAALANGLLGAAFTLGGAFEDSSQATLKQLADIKVELQQLRQDVAAMHAEMRLSFMHIDAKLDAAIALVNSGFEATLAKLDNIKTDLVSVRQQLLQQSQDFDVLRREMLQYSTDNLITPYLSDADQCLGFRARNPTGKMSANEYDRCASRFLTWGTVIARTKTLSGDANIDDLYRDGSAVLTRSVDESINTLAGVAARLQGMPLPQAVPNPLIWVAAADAFVALSTQWPEQFQNQSASVESDLIRTGGQIAGLSRSLTLKVSPDGTSVGNYELFQKLVTLYQTDLSRLSQTLRNRASGWLAGKYSDSRFMPAVLSDFRGSDEVGVSAAASPCEGSALNVGSLDIANALLPYDIALKNALTPDTVKFCYKASYQGTRNLACQSGGGFSCASVIAWGQTIIEVVGTISWEGKQHTVYRSTVKSREFPAVSGTYLGSSVAPMVPLYDPGAFLASNWKDGEKLGNSLNPARRLTDDETKDLQAVQPGIQKKTYETDIPDVRKKLNDFLRSAFSNDIDLAGAARRLGISKTLLNDFAEIALAQSYLTDGTRRFFRGDSGLWDGQVAGVSLDTADPLEELLSQAVRRTEELSQRLAAHVGSVEGTGEAELEESVHLTLDRLKMLGALKAGGG